jgi:hypothetical protein
MNCPFRREVLECGDRAQRRNRCGSDDTRGNHDTRGALESAVVAIALPAQFKPLTRGSWPPMRVPGIAATSDIDALPGVAMENHSPSG